MTDTPPLHPMEREQLQRESTLVVTVSSSGEYHDDVRSAIQKLERDESVDSTPTISFGSYDELMETLTPRVLGPSSRRTRQYQRSRPCGRQERQERSRRTQPARSARDRLFRGRGTAKTAGGVVRRTRHRTLVRPGNRRDGDGSTLTPGTTSGRRRSRVPLERPGLFSSENGQ